MDQLTPQDILRYEKLKKEASSDILKFRVNARHSAEDYQRPMRRLLEPTNTRETSTYLLLSEWTSRVAPEIEGLEAARHSAPFRNALAKHLRLPKLSATDVAKQLVDERILNINNSFLDLCYGPGRARTTAMTLLRLPIEEIIEIRDRYVTYYLYTLVADDVGALFYDPHASLLRRLYLQSAENRQVKKYLKQQTKHLENINFRQQEIKEYNNSIVSRILSLELDISLALEAHQQYKKKLDKLEPEKFTPAKRLALFTAATKKIREVHAGKESPTKKLADLQDALKALDDVLVEFFDMSDAQRTTLAKLLKEYRELEREANRITKEQSAYNSNVRALNSANQSNK